MNYARSKRFSNEWKWSTLGVLDHEIKLGIETLRRIAENQTHFVNGLKQDFDTTVRNDEVLSSLAQHYQSSYFFHTYNSDIDIMNEIVRFQRYAMVLSIYSFLECRLLDIYMVIVDKFGLINDLENKNDIIKYLYRFLTKVCNIDMTVVRGCYRNLKEQKFVRNKITHESGTFQHKYKNKFKEVNGIFLLSIDNGKYLILIENDKYCEFLLNNIESFLITILPLIDSMEDVQKNV